MEMRLPGSNALQAVSQLVCPASEAGVGIIRLYSAAEHNLVVSGLSVLGIALGGAV